jgi:hypothetical protein
MLVAAAVGRHRAGHCHEMKLSAALVAALLWPFASTARAGTTVLFDGTFNDGDTDFHGSPAEISERPAQERQACSLKIGR